MSITHLSSRYSLIKYLRTTNIRLHRRSTAARRDSCKLHELHVAHSVRNGNNMNTNMNITLRFLLNVTHGYAIAWWKKGKWRSPKPKASEEKNQHVLFPFHSHHSSHPITPHYAIYRNSTRNINWTHQKTEQNPFLIILIGRVDHHWIYWKCMIMKFVWKLECDVCVSMLSSLSWRWRWFHSIQWRIFMGKFCQFVLVPKYNIKKCWHLH